MKYIRTKDGIEKLDADREHLAEYMNSKQAKTIRELCDEFVIKYKDGTHDTMRKLKWAEMEEYNASLVGNGGTIYGAIWTDKGLIYVAKMNEKGDLELL